MERNLFQGRGASLFFPPAPIERRAPVVRTRRFFSLNYKSIEWFFGISYTTVPALIWVSKLPRVPGIYTRNPMPIVIYAMIGHFGLGLLLWCLRSIEIYNYIGKARRIFCYSNVYGTEMYVGVELYIRGGSIRWKWKFSICISGYGFEILNAMVFHHISNRCINFTISATQIQLHRN